MAVLGQGATEETLHAMRVSLGLEAPAIMRYWHWISGLLHGDLGTSLTTRTDIATILGGRLVNTFTLAGASALCSIPLSIALGIACTFQPNGKFDRIVNFGALVLLSLPAFLVAYVLVVVFSIHLDILPSLATVSDGMSTKERAYAMALPVMTLSISVFPYVFRMTRSAILDVLHQPYIEMATLKGVPRIRLILIHALRNAWAPIIQVVALNLAFLIVGVVLIEEIYVFPGIGKYFVDAVAKRDVPVIQAIALVFGTTYVILNRLADALVLFLNPRYRHPR